MNDCFLLLGVDRAVLTEPERRSAFFLDASFIASVGPGIYQTHLSIYIAAGNAHSAYEAGEGEE